MPGKKVFVKAARASEVCRGETIRNPMGREKVIQKSVHKKRIHRDETGETLVKNLAVSEFEEGKDEMRKNTISLQQL